jgi:protoporphyrinogen oxidase
MSIQINPYDIIIIGSGISGLYSALNIQKFSPSTSFLVLEKYKKQWIGGRTSNEKFHEVSIVTGEAFGDNRCVRLSYATSEALLTEAMKRIKEALAKLK